MMETIAARIIAKYLRKGNMSRCLRDILPSAPLNKEQRETVAEIVHEVVRWKKLYDRLLEEKSLDKTPERYVQLVLENAQKNGQDRELEYRYSCSSYVAHILKKKIQWAEYLNEKPPTTLCVNFNKSTPEDVMKTLTEERLPAERSQVETAVVTSSIGRYSSVIKNRQAHVQDESSQLISFLTMQQGNHIVDYCAGNGGKSLSMASMTRNNKILYAHEINEKKRSILKQRCIEYDAKVLIDERLPKQKFDVILVDAPCTGIGVARRNPEAKYVENAGKFPETQLNILRETAGFVQPGGVLVYSVCTFTPEETKEVVKQFSETNDFSVSSLKDIPFSNLLEKHTYGAFTTVPKGDIFFFALFRKES